MVGLFFALTIFGLSGCTNTVTEIEYVDREVEVPVYVNVDIPDTFNEVLGELIENHYSAPMIDELWEGALNGMIDDILSLEDPNFKALVETRILLELKTARLAALRRTDEDLEKGQSELMRQKTLLEEYATD